MDAERVLTGLFWFVAFLLSTTLHEAAHAWVALVGGDRTAYLGGQVSLNPVPHIRREPVGMLVMPLVTALLYGWAFGWASTPFDPDWARQHPKRAAVMAAAGPAANFAIAAAAFAVAYACAAGGIFEVPEQITSQLIVVAPAGGGLAFLARLLSVLVVLNVLLGVLNLLPVPSFDGAAALGIILPPGAAQAYRRLGASPIFGLVALIAAWRLLPYLVWPIIGVAVRLLRTAAG